MLEREPHDSGWQVRFHSAGLLRFFPAAFLIVWLCGWAVGEGFAAVTLAGALHALGVLPQIPGLPPIGGTIPAVGASAVILFLAVWLTLWTIGGWAALREVFRLLVGSDVVRWDSDGIEVERHAGPFHNRVRISRDEVIGIQLTHGGRAVVVDSVRRRVTLTGLGSSEDHRELANVLSTHIESWIAKAAANAADQVPMGWRMVNDEHGREALFAPWLFGGREIQVSAKTLRCGWTFAFWGRQRELAPVSLLVRKRRDSDGDEVWELVAKAHDQEQRLANAIHDPASVRHLGRWLAVRAGVELQDAA